MTVQEPLPEPSNPLGIAGIAFIEYATSQQQAFDPGGGAPKVAG
jgi:hypothetical protein